MIGAKAREDTTMATGTTHAPIHRMAWAGIAMAVVSGALALYGSMHAEKHIAGSPLREARGTTGPARPTAATLDEHVRARVGDASGPNRPNLFARAGRAAGATAEWVDHRILATTERSKIANYTLQLLVYVLPFFLGLAGALTGGWAMKLVQQSGGRYAGNTLAVFAMMVGGLACVVAGCMLVSLYVWPLMPSLYTT
jgi:hypothetical protein